MNNLYERTPGSILKILISIILICTAYLGLAYTALPFSFTFLALAGVVSLYLNYGLYGIQSAFSPLRKGAIKIIFIGLIWNVLQSFLIAFLVKYVFNFPVANNGTINIFVENTPVQFIYHFFVIVSSLIGEECLVLVPSILAIYFLKKHGVNEKRSMIIVTLVGAFLFGLAHYSTYDGNLIQIFAIIGLARLPFNWVAFKANSLWASSITHILFDMISILPVLLVALH
ncbi:hypothetical protein bcere0016_20030 [Bacillus cereus 95/8201]|uniref:CAAX protease self-immunity family protein n=1 Tax=Bacillus thuringiensis TaxID=1428 RepID=A0A0B5NK92_BACTU|nr:MULTISPECIES: CPBP family glutamic-type intramembrane protease [Bacillus cereus group]AJG76805.1 CAAX protease self-immunity family protein [Bacillus thuringiensis]AJH61113.1 CAAX protease self-immunity family protein [Bacillus cereus]AJK33535.1 CAAX protease self-immunity family protein [Bacillus cereus]EEL17363.1 hypothetical protein bcere0016_20030 [Bacillus cereus 95/8201]EEM78116.1 hypothetical protein bthur0010_19290 [Bacillus thuringiensis serovar pondicheriensis BGSC 4BA1]